jgi:hypothetical protein
MSRNNKIGRNLGKLVDCWKAGNHLTLKKKKKGCPTMRLHKKTFFAGLISMLILAAQTSAWADDYHFKDADQIPWATPSIEKLYQEGIVHGINDTEFGPFNPITRAEFTATLVKKANKRIVIQNFPYTDVNQADWFYEPVKKLYQMGIIKGESQSDFNPNGVVTREEAAVMLARTFDYSTKGVTLSYLDVQDISPWAAKSVQALVEKKVISGSDGQFRPKDPLTRAEMAVILHRILFGEPAAYHPPQQLASRSSDMMQQRLKRVVQSTLGTPYRYGGASLSGMDCSGFTSYVYKQLGVDLPRQSSDQFSVGSQVAKSDMKTGDLIFFDTGDGGISHVGIYMGDNQMAHAATKQDQVMVTDLDWYFKNYRVVGIKRIFT